MRMNVDGGDMSNALIIFSEGGGSDTPLFNLQYQSNFYNECGLYSLILRSMKPGVNALKNLVTSDVLPLFTSKKSTNLET